MSKPRYQQQMHLKQNPICDRKLKILMLTWEFPPNIIGGLSRHVFGLSVHLASLGHEVHVITARGNDLQAEEIVNGVNVHRINPVNEQDESFLAWIGGLNLAFAFLAEKLAMDIPFDLIHAHDWLVGSAAIVLRDLLGLPLLATIHATEHGRNNGIYSEMQRFIYEKEKQLISASDQLIVCSEYMKASLMDVFETSDEKIAVIPNGIEPPEITSKTEEIFPDLAQKRYIFSLGRMVKEKGFETIIAAAVIAREKGLGYYFVIAGKGPLLDRYRRLINEKNLAGYVQFVGYITDEERNALISGCELAVIPSLYEPFGIAALETMILGKPTIVSSTGGLGKIVDHMQTGLLMIPGNPESLLKQIQFLMNHPDRAKEIGKKGSQMVKSLFGWDRIASETSKIMKDFLLRNRIFDRKI